MTPKDATPALIPGVPASTWVRTFAVINYVGIPLIAAFVAVEIFGSRVVHDAWAGPPLTCFLILLAASVVDLVIFRRREKRETAAGYTTQWRNQSTLPQLDARTGQLIRKAGAPYVRPSDWRERARMGGSGVVAEGERSPWQMAGPSPWLSFLGLIGKVLAPIIAVSALIGLITRPGGDIVTRAVVYGSVVIVSLLAILLIGTAVVRSRLTRLRAVAPHDLIFVFAKSTGYSAGYQALAMHAPPVTGYTARGASADSAGLTVWEGNPLRQTLHWGWDVVTSIQIGSVPDGNQSDNLVNITVKTHGGEFATVPLAYPKASAFPIPTKAGVQWIVDQLNYLRGGKTTARVL